MTRFEIYILLTAAWLVVGLLLMAQPSSGYRYAAVFVCFQQVVGWAWSLYREDKRVGGGS